ncbi:other/FunK1 protein kinase [Coprinopsis cinerea okayama7|uniref:Other/FunK1 protein kinase n=1 Tax=Coprinopsis cinerea (strain Okayama-7 / 130 / ATCC MYA-4618 / FGSC 9003) TaxID=240176 RepID=A8NAV5_COPC7|nr:other/FunK1 protein kinase [Coprinopsis cinerea okayama7\|eukprot:XP_001831957.2 other/FunK1 protein kinase [Coprinopsis cinerea okayama7\
MVNDVTVCNFEEFFEKYLPNPGVQLDAVVDELKKQKMLVSRGGSLHQKSYSSKKGSLLSHTFKSFKSLFRSRTTNPTRVMKAIQTIGNAVRSALGKATDCEASDFSVRAEKSTGLSAYGSITSKLEGPLRPTDVMVPIMVNPDNNVNEPDLNQENAAFLSCAAEVMHGDARRIFCFGITLEGPEVTMWRFSRTLTMKTTPFDMTERPDLLIQMFTSLLSSSACDLGHDPLVTLLPDANYIYEIPSDGGTGPLYYRTITSICDARPSGVSGRRLRVWEVEQVESISNPVRVPGTATRALKDVFLDSGVRTEADIQQDLFDDIEKLAQDAAWRSRPLLKDFPQRDINDLAYALEGGKFRQYFSCIVAKHVREANPLDNVEEEDETGVAAPEDYQINSIGESEVVPPVPRRVRRRCLFVYEHVCTPLNDIPALGEAIDVLKLVLRPLRLMFLAGWVHRDISPGNILAYREVPGSPWTVKLSDLEHAKRFPDSESSGADRIVVSRPSKPFPVSQLTLPDREHPISLPMKSTQGHAFSPEVSPRDAPCWLQDPGPVVHNYQHDLESIWWILLWLVAMRINQKLPRKFAATYFKQKVGYHRGSLITNNLAYDIELHKSLPPVLQRSAFFIALDHLRHYLYIAYTTRSTNLNHDDVSSFSSIVSEGMNGFFDAIKASREQWADIDLIVDSKPRKAEAPPASTSPPSTLEQRHDDSSTNKRQAEDSGEGGRARKRARPSAVRYTAIAPRRTGPTTRAMAKNEVRVTRSMTRRLQEEEKQKKGD